GGYGQVAGDGAVAVPGVEEFGDVSGHGGGGHQAATSSAWRTGIPVATDTTCAASSGGTALAICRNRFDSLPWNGWSARNPSRTAASARSRGRFSRSSRPSTLTHWKSCRAWPATRVPAGWSKRRTVALDRLPCRSTHQDRAFSVSVHDG